MIVLETQYKQRAFDGKWERVVKTLDYENSYSFTNEVGNKVTYIPEKWICTKVFDLMGELILEEGTVY